MKIIISATGNDRPGIVSELSSIITNHGGNVEESRMIKLGSEFSVIMLIALKNDDDLQLQKSFNSIDDLSVISKKIEINEEISNLRYDIHLHGADNEGIVAVLSKYLAEKSINIIEMNTHISQAPMTGAPLFNLDAEVTIPEDIIELNINNDLGIMSKKLGIDIILMKTD